MALCLFAESVPGVEHALLLSSDGMAVASSKMLLPDDGERLATVSAAAIGLAEGSTRSSGIGAVREIMIVMARSLLFVTQIAEGSSLAVLSDASADLAKVGQEMGMLIARLADQLGQTVGCVTAR
jgi:predicted regulator of Ras-like GTPase activity (Roadblock/LC7/MglB family)